MAKIHLLASKCEDERRRGYLAKERLARELKGAQIKIEREGKDRYGRTLARVYASGRDVGQILVGEGFARAYDGRTSRQSWCN